MFKLLLALKRGLVRLLEVSLMASVAILVVDVLWQIFTRFVMKDPSRWTEEAATLLLIWVSLLGGAVAYARKGHLGVDYFVGKMDPGGRLLVECVVHTLVGFFAASVMIYGGLQLVTGTLAVNQLTPALQMKMGYVYLAVPISGAFILLFAIEMLVENIRLLRGAGPTEEPA